MDRSAESNLEAVARDLKPLLRTLAKTCGGGSKDLLQKTPIYAEPEELDAFQEEHFFFRWNMSEYLNTKLQSMIELHQVEADEATMKGATFAIEILSYVLDGKFMIPTLNVRSAIDYALSYCMTVQSKIIDYDTGQAMLNFLHQYASYARETQAMKHLSEALQETKTTQNNRIHYVLAECEDSSVFLEGLQVGSFAESTVDASIDEMMLLSNMMTME